MKRTPVSGGAFVTLLGLLVFALDYRPLEGEVNASAKATSPAGIASTASTEEVSQGFLYGRVTTDGGVAYVGRLRFGRDEEAFWGDSCSSSSTAVSGRSTCGGPTSRASISTGRRRCTRRPAGVSRAAHHS
jgi:hypothetical protein